MARPNHVIPMVLLIFISYIPIALLMPLTIP
jgi:hypothetical protein